MFTRPIAFKIVAAVVLTVFVVTVGILNLRDRISWFEATDGVFWEETPSGLRAAEVDPAGPGGAAGIRAGENLLAINGRGIANLGDLVSLLDELGANAQATYALASEGGLRELQLQVGARVIVGPRDILRTLLAFFYLAAGLAVVLRGGGRARAFHFYLICLAAFVLFLFSYTPKLAALDWLVYVFSVASLLLLPALFVHFCMRFPVDVVRRGSRAPWVYAPAVLLGLVQLFWMTGRLAAFGLPRTAQANLLLERTQLSYLCAGLLAGGVLLVLRRARTEDFIARRQLKWIGLGTLMGVLPFSLIYAIPFLLGYRPGVLMESSILSLGVLPVAFAYAVIRFRLLDVEIIVRRGAAYFLASTLLLAVYLLFVLAVGRTLQAILPEADFLVVAGAALAVALLFAPLRNAIQARLDRFFYKDQFEDRASLLEFARALTSEISLGPLARSILERVQRTFRIEKCALLLADARHPGAFRLIDAAGLDYPAGAAPYFREEEIIGRHAADPAAALDPQGRLCAARGPLADRGILYLQELRVHGRRIGLIGLGALPPGRHFSTEDLDLLGALAGYASIALDNASLYRSVETKAFELERLKAYTENILESINVAVAALDADGRVSSCNRAFEELMGVARAQVRGAQVESLLQEDVVAAVRKASGASGWNIHSPANIFKLYLENRRGARLIVNLSVIPLLERSDLNTGCLLVLDDVTSRVQLEDQLLQSEKLSSIGLLAAGIAHEVNTPITGISSYTQMLLRDLPDSDPRKPILEKIEKQTFRAAEIVTGLLNFSRVNGSEYADLDINKLISESLTLLEHQMRKSRIRVEASLGGGLPPVYGNSGKLQQVFVNLFLNARDAMMSGGELNVRTAMNDEMVVVEIRDNGVGIPQDDIKRIYDPFFTTKTTGKGTGLGLAVTYGIIQEHGGRILVDSEPGKGTHFRLKLPTRHAPAR